MCQNIHPTIDMNMGFIRRTIMKGLHISDHDACRISNKDSHIYCKFQRSQATAKKNFGLPQIHLFTDIGPFYFRKTTYQVSLNVNALGHHSIDEFDQLRIRELSSIRMQVILRTINTESVEAHFF
jgi:hypothetical protein